MSNQPYPWATPQMLSRSEAPEVYEIEDRLRETLEELEVELENHIEGDKWKQRVPYMLFCILEGYNHESAIAATLGYLRHVRDMDKQTGTKRESLKGLRLPNKP